MNIFTIILQYQILIKVHLTIVGINAILYIYYLMNYFHFIFNYLDKIKS